MSEFLTLLKKYDGVELTDFELDALKMFIKRNTKDKTAVNDYLKSKALKPTNPFTGFGYDDIKYINVKRHFATNDLSGYYATQKQWENAGYKIKENEQKIMSHTVYGKEVKLYAYEQTANA